MKQSLAARFLFRAVVLALLVYAMLLTWWTPFTGDSFMHSVFGAGHRLAFQPVLERCWWSYMNWNPVFIQAGHHDVLAVRRDKLCVVSRRLAGLPVPVPRLMGRDLPD